MSERDDRIIAKYATGKEAAIIRNIAEIHGGIARVENGKFIFADGIPMDIKGKSLGERWAEEMESRPADWLQDC